MIGRGEGRGGGKYSDDSQGEGDALRMHVLHGTCMYMYDQVPKLLEMYMYVAVNPLSVQIMGSRVVSCKNGHGIKELRDLIFDVASQVKENTGSSMHTLGCHSNCSEILFFVYVCLCKCHENGL